MSSAELATITHVWSSFGHRFYSGDGWSDHADGTSYERCMTCGAEYELRRRPGDPTGGEYMAANGDDPVECAGDTAMCHGEQPCQADNGRPCNGGVEPCLHEPHECNCLLCTG
jgi:hypothetical protein